jgi:hypothetical protein
MKREITLLTHTPSPKTGYFFYIITEVYAVIPVCILKYDKQHIQQFKGTNDVLQQVNLKF